MNGRHAAASLQKVLQTARMIILPMMIAGCSGGETAPTATLHKVSGKVIPGRPGPLAGAMIHFVPAQGGSGARYATGELKDDGSFELTTEGAGEGIAEGSYKLKLIPPPQKIGEKAKTSIIPPHLADEDGSGMTATIGASTTTIPPLKLSDYPPKGSTGGRDRN